MKSVALLFLLTFCLVATACEPDELNSEEEVRLRAMDVSPEDTLPASPTNLQADNLEAAQLGKSIFFDENMSDDQTISCASCHLQDEGWSDDRPVSLGVREEQGNRHSMPIHSIATQSFFFWDGRADSAWSQTLQAIESAPEMDFARTQVAHHIADNYAEPYEAIFGALPDLSDIPQRAKPGDIAWEALSDEQQDDVNRIFSNTGKLLEAYQRRLACTDTRFDQWARGEVTMSRAENQGAALFIREGCIDCHSGSAFSDGAFHNLGVPSSAEEGNTGRAEGLTLLLDNPFNGAGKWSDDQDYGTQKLVEAMEETRTLGAFRTPTLRGVTQRRSFGHSGSEATLVGFMERFYNGNRNRNRNNGIGTRDPLLNGVNLRDEEDIIPFLRMLECPDPAPEWAAP